MITPFDGLLGSFYFLIIMIIGWSHSKKKIAEGKLNYKYYLPSLFIHLFGVTFFCLVYGFYYGGGDSYYYFRGGSSLVSSILDYPFDTFLLYGYNVNSIPVDIAYLKSSLFAGNSDQTFLMMKLASLFCFVGFNGFFASSVVLGWLSFYFNWKLFVTVNKAFFIAKVSAPKLFYILFIPSLFFWGTGILKDTYVFIFSTYLIIYFIELFNIKNQQNKLLKFCLFLLFSFFITYLKSYVFYTVFGSLLVAYYGEALKMSSIVRSSKIIRYSVNTLFGGLLLLLIFLGSQAFQADILDAQKEAITTLQGFHDWHTTLGGSSYSLGITDYSIFGILSQSPLAFLVTYFGPFPWQINSPIMLFTAFESYFYLYLFLLAIKRQKMKLFSLFNKHNIILFSMIFSILFGVLVGITSYNYGALARFKIQALPYFIIWITSVRFPQKS